jgi:hypothetical protein
VSIDLSPHISSSDPDLERVLEKIQGARIRCEADALRMPGQNG